MVGLELIFSRKFSKKFHFHIQHPKRSSTSDLDVPTFVFFSRGCVSQLTTSVGRFAAKEVHGADES